MFKLNIILRNRMFGFPSKEMKSTVLSRFTERIHKSAGELFILSIIYMIEKGSN